MTMDKILQTAEYIKEQAGVRPKVGLILGSGLGALAEIVENKKVIPYAKIPNFPVSTVEGHAGQLVFGDLDGVSVVMMQGRFHFYEGYPMQEVTFPVRVMKALGIETLVVTNAAGGINQEFSAGDLMLITDHINFMGTNPLIGPNDTQMGVRFPDLSNAYDKQLQTIAKTVASELHIPLKEGVYVAVSGPSYETPAEIRAFRTIGGDAVGMSTVPEVIIANHSGLKVLGISCITNMAAGVLDQPLAHEEVIETTERVKEHFLTLVKTIVKRLNV